MEETNEIFWTETSTGGAPEAALPPEPLKKTRKHFSRIGLFFFLGAIIIIITQAVLSFLVSYLRPDWLNDSNIALLLSVAPMYLIGMPALIALVKIVPAAQVERHSMKGGQFAVAAVMTFAIMYGSNFIGLMITTFIGQLKGSMVENELVDLVDSLNIPLMFIYMVVIAPIMEEYVFRKLIVDRAVRYGQGVAVVLSGLMFGLFHGNLNQFIYTFALGTFLAFLYVKTGNLKITITLHAMVNFMGSIVASTLLDLVDLDRLVEISEGGFDNSAYMAYLMDNALGFLAYLVYLIFLFGVIIAGGILLIIALVKGRFRFTPGEVVIPRGKRFRTVILNVGMLLYCIFWSIMIVLQLLL